MEYKDLTGRVIKKGDYVAVNSKYAVNVLKVGEVNDHGVFLKRTRARVDSLRPFTQSNNMLIVTSLCEDGTIPPHVIG